jgi:hypothetical protein
LIVFLWFFLLLSRGLLGVIAPGASIFSLLIVKPHSYIKISLPKTTNNMSISLIKTEKIYMPCYLENISKAAVLTRRNKRR